MIDNHQDVVNSINHITKTHHNNSGNSNTQYKLGRSAFRFLYKEYLECYNITNDIKDAWDNFSTNRQPELSHYYRTTYHVLKFLNEAVEIDESTKFKYSQIFRALFTNYELNILFYYGLSDDGKSHFKPLVEKYSFLKISNLELCEELHKEHYDVLSFAYSSEREKILLERASKIKDQAEE